MNNLPEPTPAFKDKSPEVQRLVLEAIEVLTLLGIPFMDITWRRVERIAMVFLATCQVSTIHGWENTKDLNNGINMKTRDIIKYVNESYQGLYSGHRLHYSVSGSSEIS
jgi:hypothetical protein